MCFMGGMNMLTHWHSNASCRTTLNVSTHSSPDGDTMAQRCKYFSAVTWSQRRERERGTQAMSSCHATSCIFSQKTSLGCLAQRCSSNKRTPGSAKPLLQGVCSTCNQQ
jgi:hypothetical protein